MYVKFLLFFMLCLAINFNFSSAKESLPEDTQVVSLAETKENTFIDYKTSHFKKGTFDKVYLGVLDKNTNAAKITLSRQNNKYLPKGVYTSPFFEVSEFTELIISQNSTTPRGTSIEIQAQVMIDGKPSNWFSWGKQKSLEPSSSAKTNPQDNNILLDIDTFNILNDKKSTCFRYRVIFSTDNTAVSPELNLIAFSFRKINNNEIFSLKLPNNISDLNKEKINLQVPCFSQNSYNKDIASRICSPTSLSMVLGYYNINVNAEKIAASVYDNTNDIYGNWVFNTAYLSKYNFTSYVAFLNSIEDIVKELKEGRPVIASVIYKNSLNVKKDLPVLNNAPITYTFGHIVVIRGIVTENNITYFLVNDPAAPSDNVLRKYDIKEFSQASTGVFYIIKKND